MPRPARSLDAVAVAGEGVVGLYAVGLLAVSTVPAATAVARSAFVALIVAVAAATALRGSRTPAGEHIAGNAVAGALAIAIGSVGLGLSAGAGLSALPIEGLSAAAVAGVVALVAALFVAAAGTIWLFRPLRGWLRLAALPVWLEVAQFVALPVFIGSLAAFPPHTPLRSANPAPALDVRFSAADGTVLAGWLTPGTNGRTVIVIPGGGATRDNTLAQSAVLARNGFTVLNYDPRGVGESGGREMLFGWGWESDLGAAVDFLETQPGVEATRIGVLGLSIGAQVALSGAASDRRLRAVVAEGASARVCGDLVFWGGDPQSEVSRIDHCLGWAVASVLSGAAEPSTLTTSAAALGSTPVLLIAADNYRERLANETIRSVSPATITLWEPAGASHTAALWAYPAEWERRVVEFLDAWL
jgi:uncharacterized protein